MLSFQKLDVYRCAIEFLAVDEVAAEFAQGAMRRWATNCDELPSRCRSTSPKLREELRSRCARHYAIARGSAMECAAVLDALRCLRVVDERETPQGLPSSLLGSLRC